MTSRPDLRPGRHLDGVDLMRVITIAGVIAVHVVTGTNRSTSVPAGAATILLHVNREVFVLITALVLAHSYGARRSWSLRRFWARRYWLVATPYVVWTAVYLLADGPLPDPLAALRQFAIDLATGNARYHLYFLLVTMQLYLVFPLLLALVRATRGRHGLLLAASAALQLAFTAAFHYRLVSGGVLGWWFAHPDPLLVSYQLYVLAGAIVAFHLDELTAWVKRHRLIVVLTVVAGVLVGLGSYEYDVAVRVLRPLTASEVFQPAVTIESLAVLLGLFALGVWWASKPRTGWLGRAVAQASDASFGIYLAHPLVLQGLLAVAGVTGLLQAVLGLSGRYGLMIGLLGVLPLVLIVTWAGVWIARRGPLSLPMAGRPAIPAPARHPAWAADGIRTLALAVCLAAIVTWLDLSGARVAAPGAAFEMPPPDPSAAMLAASDTPVAPPGTVGTVETIRSGGLMRSYQVISPAQPAAQQLPAIVFLHGVNADLGTEEVRDGLLPLASAGRVVLVYPVGYEQSWNAGSCCGGAQLRDIDDVGFIAAVKKRVAAMPQVDPDQVSLAGYSNGGKMAFRIACERPSLFETVTVVLAIPVNGCQPSRPVRLLQVAVQDDPEIPYTQGSGPLTANGVLLTPVTTVVASWRSRDGCSGAPVTGTAGHLRTELWQQCQKGSRVELATYAAGGHYWPAGDADTPPAGQVLWEFVNPAS